MSKCLVEKLDAVVNIEGLPKIIIVDDDTRAIMENYASAPSSAAYELQKFFVSVSSFRSKIKELYLPIFSSNVSESRYNAINGNTITAESNDASAYVFNSDNHTFYTQTNAANYAKKTFNNIGSTVWGKLSIAAIVPIDLYTNWFKSYINNKTTVAVGNLPASPSVKFFGQKGYYNNDDETDTSGCDIRFYTDNGIGNRTPMTQANAGDTAKCQLLGSWTSVQETSVGFRIFAIGEGLTDEEYVVLRGALLELDNAYYD